MNKKLSTVVITFNEEQNIQKFIEDFSFTDEIIVLDSYSTDKTTEIAKQHPKVKVFYRVFDNFTNQKNHAMSLAGNDWILFFDADERIDDRFREEIRHRLSSEEDTYAYYVKRDFYVKDKRIKYSGFQNDYAVRLLNKNYCSYSPTRFVHEQIICKKGKTQKMSTPIQHYFFKDGDTFIAKLDLYAQLKAQEHFKEGIQPNFFHFVVKPWFRFVHHYIIRLGFMDGEEGLLLANLYRNYVKNRYLYLEKLNTSL